MLVLGRVHSHLVVLMLREMNFLFHRNLIPSIWGFPKMVLPNNYWFSYQKWPFWGVFGGTTILGNTHIVLKPELTKHTAYNLNLQTKGGGGVHELVGETTPIPFQTKIYAHKFGAFPQVRVNIKNFEVTISSIPCMRLGMIWIEKGEKTCF